MAAKPMPMSQIKQLLRLHSRGAGKKHIARSLQISRNTVKSYLCKLSEAGWSTEELLELDDHELERRFHSGSRAYKDDRFADFAERTDYFAKELRRVGVTQLLLWQDYRLARGYFGHMVPLTTGDGYSGAFCHPSRGFISDLSGITFSKRWIIFNMPEMHWTTEWWKRSRT